MRVENSERSTVQVARDALPPGRATCSASAAGPQQGALRRSTAPTRADRRLVARRVRRRSVPTAAGRLTVGRPMAHARRRSSRPTTSGAPFPTSSTPTSCRRIGAAFARFVAERRRRRPGCSSPATCARRASSWSPRSPTACSARASTSSTSGWCSTDLLYFAAGQLDAPGAMFTASHNPAQYNGIKMCLSGARPIGEDTGLRRDQGAGAAADARRRRPRPGTRQRGATCSATSPTTCTPSSTSARCARSRSSPTPPTAWAASSSPPCSPSCPFDLEILFGELDGTFPNHPADPIQPENLRRPAGPGARDRRRHRPRLRRRRRPGVPRRREGRAAVRLAHHGHRRRRHAGPSTPARTVIHNLICSKAVPEVVRGDGRHAGPHPGRPLASSRRSWPRPAPSSAASTRGTTTSATTTGPTPASSPPWSCSSSCARSGMPLSRAAQAVRALRRVGRDQHRGRPTRGRHRAGRRRLRRTLRRAGPPRRPHRRPRRLVVQPAPVEHRAAAAAQPRGRRRRPRSSAHVAEVTLGRSAEHDPAGANDGPWRSTPNCSRSSPAPRTRARCSTSRTRTALYNPRLHAPLRASTTTSRSC